MNTTNLIAKQSVRNVESMRSQAEILAKYHQDCQQYKTLKTSDGDHREQLLTMYTEIKLLGWVLGKNDQTIIHDANV